MRTDIAGIERATLAAVSPDGQLEQDGWLLGFGSGSIWRAKSAAPLAHTSLSALQAEVCVDAIEQQYQTWAQGRATGAGGNAIFRLADVPCFDNLRQHLARRAYVPVKPTWVQVAQVEPMLQVAQGEPADVDASPDTAWAQLFLGEGFDAVDGANRIRNLTRAGSGAGANVYASVREGGPTAPQTLAGGAASFSHGWASVHGMRTHAQRRGQGLAGRVLKALALAARERGLNQVFLQVEANNPSAQALYRRAGFTTAWVYRYWCKI